MSQGADTTEGGSVESGEDLAGSLAEFHEAEQSQEGEESGAEAQDSEEPTETEDETSEVETESDEDEGSSGADSEKSEPGSEADEQQANPLMEELRSLRAEVMSLRAARQEPEAQTQQAPRGPDPTEVFAVKDAILRLYSAVPGEEAKALAGLSPKVREEAIARASRGHEAVALLAADDGAFTQTHVIPHLVPFLRAIAEEVQAIKKDRNLEKFAVRHSGFLQDKTALQEVQDWMAKGVPEEAAVELVRSKRELAALNKQKAKVTQKETEQRALSSSRRAQAARKPDMKGKPPAKPKGGRFQDFVEAYEPRYRAATEE